MTFGACSKCGCSWHECECVEQALKNPIPTESKLIRTWPGSKGAVYEFREGGDGIVFCTCSAWKFSRESPKTCKHLISWANWVAKNGENDES